VLVEGVEERFLPFLADGVSKEALVFIDELQSLGNDIIPWYLVFILCDKVIDSVCIKPVDQIIFRAEIIVERLASHAAVSDNIAD
jgi:hypothetical protein